MLKVRAYRDSDAEAVVAVLNQVPELPEMKAEGFRSFVDHPFNQAGQDFRVATLRGELVGVLTSALLRDGGSPVRHFRIVVSPANRERGAGRALYQALLEQERPDGGRLSCNCFRSWVAGRSLLERRGFVVDKSDYLMKVELPARLASAVPTGVLLRDEQAADDPALARLHEEAYGGEEDFVAMGPQALLHERQAPGYFRLVAELDGEPIGFVHCENESEGKGRVSSLVVARKQRCRGLGAALLCASLVRLHEGGMKSATLNVYADNVAACRLYRSAGFQPTETIDRMVRAMSGQA